MNDKFRIVLKDRLLPVQVFFNAIPDRSFIETLKAFGNATGAGFNDAFCGFPGEEDFDEEPLNGIEFAVKGEEVIIGYDEFFSILEEVCNVYSEKHPNETELVQGLLFDVKEKLNSL
ncbi:ribonuclease toxin immunity protein CdiI [Amphritea pacifica]|uniref:CDI immunity protein domain-containing protein n=1 Tax=Amphritea pacifica TaxID=2811233 RepID=A0ABS2WD42_9GAMM|nr:ribonuclease toxin immunity protein CdiI [Amphritea pacifica]MBN0989604.1 hypothetical protein [Amphritea pacifica]